LRVHGGLVACGSRAWTLGSGGGPGGHPYLPAQLLPSAPFLQTCAVNLTGPRRPKRRASAPSLSRAFASFQADRGVRRPRQAASAASKEGDRRTPGQEGHPVTGGDFQWSMPRLRAAKLSENGTAASQGSRALRPAGRGRGGPLGTLRRGRHHPRPLRARRGRAPRGGTEPRRPAGDEFSRPQTAPTAPPRPHPVGGPSSKQLSATDFPPSPPSRSAGLRIPKPRSAAGSPPKHRRDLVSADALQGRGPRFLNPSAAPSHRGGPA